MRTSRILSAAIGVCALTASMPAAPPAAPNPTAGAAPAASAPAPASPQEIAAKGGLLDFFQAMFDGDQQAAFACLVYTDAKNQPAAETMFGEIVAEQRLRKAVAGAFGDKAKEFDLGMSDADVADFKKQVQTATVKLDTGSAVIQMSMGPTFVVIMQGGKWLVDFDKTQANMGPLPKGEDLTALTKKIAGYDQLAQDVAAKKFATVEEVTKQVDKIDADAESKTAAPETAPASKPATRP